MTAEPRFDHDESYQRHTSPEPQQGSCWPACAQLVVAMFETYPAEGLKYWRRISQNQPYPFTTRNLRDDNHFHTSLKVGPRR